MIVRVQKNASKWYKNKGQSLASAPSAHISPLLPFVTSASLTVPSDSTVVEQTTMEPDIL